VELGNGTHTLTWSYTKDGSVNASGDYFAVSNVRFTSYAPEAYACYTPSNTTLTFYYDNQRSSRTGTTYDLNTGANITGWESDGTNASVTKVVFDPSFAGARPTTTWSWFYSMTNLQSITGMSYLNTSEVTNMSWMFGFCTILPSLDVSSFNTANVTNMSCVFYGCASITSLNLSSFNTSKVTSMANLFRNCTNLQTIYAGNGWSTAAVTNSGYMFDKCNSLVGGQGTTWDRDKPKDKTYAHIDGGPSDPGYFTEWKEAYACYTPSNTTLTFYYDGQRSSRTGTTYDLNTGYNTPGWEADGYNGNVTKVVFDPSFANARPTSTYDWFYEMKYLQSITGINYLNTSEVTNMSWMFGYCWSLTEVDVSRFSTANVTSMRSMFHACYHLSSLDLSNFNTANVNNMRNMFNACGEIQSLDLSSFNTANVADMNGMFVDCALLRTVYVSDGWSTAAVTNSSNMFLNCSSLVGGRGTTYDASHTDAGYAHIDGGPGNPGYFSDKNASQRGDVDGDGNINITDVTVLIDCLLSGMTPPAAADCDQDGNVNITDVTVLIDYLLAGYW
jgi:surface protein